MDNKNNIYDFNNLGGYETQEQIDHALKYNRPNIVPLDVPKNPTQVPQNTQQYHTTMDSPDDYLHSAHQPNKPVGASGPALPGGLHTNLGLMHTTDIIIALHPIPIGDPYYFWGSISEEVLHRYLERSIEMDSFFMWCQYYKNPYPGTFKTTSEAGTLKPAGRGPSFHPDIEFWLDGPNVLTGTGITHHINISPGAPGVDYYLNHIVKNLNYQIGQDMQMLTNLKPKMIGTGGFYTLKVPNGSVNPQRDGSPGKTWGDNLPIGPHDNPVTWLFTFAKINIDYYHQKIDKDAIFGAVIFEQCDASFNNIPIPAYVRDAFPGSAMYPGINFNIGSMMINHPGDPGYLDPSVSGHYVFIMDLTRLLTQMWFYYIATGYIDAGYESLFIGDTFTMTFRDRPNGYPALWGLLQKIRHYASTRNRGVVLCSGTSYGDPNFYFYYDPPGPIEPDWKRQLIFDSGANKIPISRRYGAPGCHNGNGLVDGSGTYYWGRDTSETVVPGIPATPYAPSNYPAEIYATHYKGDVFGPVLNTNWHPHILYDFKGGLSPQGWFCVQQPVVLGFDVTNSFEHNAGCYFAGASNWYDFGDYGWQQFSWFALQSYHTRNEILKYIFDRIKCINPLAHVCMVGRNNAFYTNWHNLRIDRTVIYRANDIIISTDYTTPDNLNHAEGHDFTDLTGVYGQETTIKKLWDGDPALTPPDAWQHHNFSYQNVGNAFNKVLNGDGSYSYSPLATAPTATSSLLFVGTDKIFFIAHDGYIHGYIKVGDNNNGGTWLTVSPSFSAQIYYGQYASTQVKAKSGLIANAAGNMLYYIGVDDGAVLIWFAYI